MFQLLKIGFNTVVYSLGYQFVFIVLSYHYGVECIYGFELTYWAQFLYLLIIGFCGPIANNYLTASNLDKASPLAVEYHKTVELLGVFFTVLFYGFCVLFAERIMNFFSIPGEYYVLCLLGYCVCGVMAPVFVVTENLVFEGHSTRAVGLSAGLCGILIGLAFVLGFVVSDRDAAICVIMAVVLVYATVVCVVRFWGGFRLRLAVLKQIRFVWSDALAQLAVMFTYILSLYRQDIGVTMQYLSTLVISKLSMDIAWDASGAGSTYYLMVLKDTKDNKVRSVTGLSVLYFVVLLCVSVCMMLVSNKGFSLTSDMWFLLGINVVSLFVYMFTHPKNQHLLVTGYELQVNLIRFVRTVLRPVCAVLIVSPYSSEYAVLIGAVLYFVPVHLLYWWAQRKFCAA